MADTEILRLIAARTGLGLKFLSKEDKISRLLSQLSGLSGLRMALKGGTALNRLYMGDAARFSEDLDIDLFGDVPHREKVAILKDKLTGMEDFEIKGPRMLHNIARFDAYYVNEFGERDRVMMDFYLSHTEPLAAGPLKENLISSRFLETHPALFPCYSLEDLLARKLAAFHGRSQGKDLYDLFYGLEQETDIGVLAEAIRGVMGFYRIEGGPQDLFRAIADRREILLKDAVSMGNTANHYIPRSLRPEWKVLVSSLLERMEDVRGRLAKNSRE